MEQRFISIEKDVSDVKKDITEMNTRLAIAEAGLKDVKEDIRSIKDDTKWLRRSITNALIVALVGGAVAIFYAAIKLNQ
ncbi:hemolysin XhlA family protein [Cytobacillus praedii]|uniref:hemolysin XhlA family protein n=1 Tax=Cytobacillus praedii TaxID=1742358 RepID=UPI003F7E96FA